MSLRWTDEQLQDYKNRLGFSPLYQGEKPKKKSKLRNVKVKAEGRTFDSKHEYQRYCELKMLERSGRITDLKLQVAFELAPSVVLDGRKKPPLRYFADFVYFIGGNRIVEDAKSDITRKEKPYRIKKHLMMSVHGIEIRET